MIKLCKISKNYIKNKKTIEVLKNIDYVFRPNTLYCIIGNSGAGKSTLIQILGLLLPLSDGELIINNKNTKDLNDDEKSNIRNKEIGFIFQSYYLNPLMKAYENVLLPTYVNKSIKDNDRKKLASEILEKLGLKDRINHYPKELSGGEQQRVAIARALINNPSIILADEPTGSLDPENEEKIMKILKNLSKNGKCVIVVSHSNTVKNYADIVLKLENGYLKEVSK